MKTKLTPYERLCMRYKVIDRMKEIAIETHGRKTQTINEICEWYTPIILDLSDKELIQHHENLILYPQPLV